MGTGDLTLYSKSWGSDRQLLPQSGNAEQELIHRQRWQEAADQYSDEALGKFAKDAFDIGINYLGVCCGANPMLIRQVAEAVGLKVPASKYREDMSTHMLFGTNKRIPKHQRDYQDKA